MAHRGINYDTGTRYAPGVDSRPDWSPVLLDRHVRTISDELGANAVNVFGSCPARLLAATEAAVGAGLDVWVQPRLPDGTREETVALVDEVASSVEPLRAAGHPVRMNVGCELTVFTRGLLPGRTVEQRAAALRWTWPLLPVFALRLDRLLRRLVATARARFDGEITYGAGSWETVAWRRFDAVGLNLYGADTHPHRAAATLQRAARHRLPVLVTEFGCCSYPGADERAAEGDAVVDWEAAGGPAVAGVHPRDEDVQARSIGRALDVFADSDVTGAFVFEYSEPLYPRADDPRRDLDVASFGIVAVTGGAVAGGHRFVETRKAAFHEIARRYRDACDTR